MESESLTTLGEELLASARSANAGRAARTILGGHTHRLRQTLIALLAGRAMGEHDSPGEATIQVLRGSVRLTSTNHDWSGSEGSLGIIPPERHELEAKEDSLVLLTVVVDL
ncbi:LuxR family transcriptional regulator [Tessaracoccus rhinocerotis]|uniref:LuxR family transcriptional regulator n=1 Tax=Tessaracoccus rhinocerotis TaxID=1689449 RepID=A0A553K4G0_9ACTN|nr:LuxR family transcriptional regulator [Tessaracoccus rhinocerotis]TRY19583.1 LuxR family transcriptional regulator [Tessaracoccus rhinocerotis]